MGRLVFLFLMTGVLNSGKVAAQLRLKPHTDTSAKHISAKVLPQKFYSQQLGYFCKKELQLQRITGLPLFIRLGSKEHVDYLEKKPNAIKRF